MITDHKCALCGEAASGSLVMHQDFMVLPSVGGITAGHVLLVPKRHVRRWLDLDAGERSQADRLKQQLSTRLRQRFCTDIHFFEHGSNAHGPGVACSVEHAHMHAVPYKGSVLGRLQYDYFWQPVTGWQQMEHLVGENEYLWYQAPDGSQGVSVNQDGFPSQYLRRVFAEESGVAEWNWREFPRSSTMTQTVLGFAAAPAEN